MFWKRSYPVTDLRFDLAGARKSSKGTGTPRFLERLRRPTYIGSNKHVIPVLLKLVNKISK
jgi:hypothetical protein